MASKLLAARMDCKSHAMIKFQFAEYHGRYATRTNTNDSSQTSSRNGAFQDDAFGRAHGLCQPNGDGYLE
jgi:hypothetical protein